MTADERWKNKVERDIEGIFSCVNGLRTTLAVIHANTKETPEQVADLEGRLDEVEKAAAVTEAVSEAAATTAGEAKKSLKWLIGVAVGVIGLLAKFWPGG